MMNSKFSTMLGTTLLGAALLLFFVGCAGGQKSRDDRASGGKGNLIVHNQSGVELAIYVDKVYEKTVKTGDWCTINVFYAEAAGTIVEVECFIREKLGDVLVYPSDQNANYYNFGKVVRPLGSPESVIPIHIPPSLRN